MSRWQLFMRAVPARPKKATPSCSSEGRAWYLSMKMSAIGWPEPMTGMVRAWLQREHRRISPVSSLISEIARVRYLS